MNNGVLIGAADGAVERIKLAAELERLRHTNITEDDVYQALLERGRVSKGIVKNARP